MVQQASLCSVFSHLPCIRQKGSAAYLTFIGFILLPITIASGHHVKPTGLSGFHGLSGAAAHCPQLRSATGLGPPSPFLSRSRCFLGSSPSANTLVKCSQG
ncbi:hypothetical protein KIL84_007012 [Mauremys mutica]|uniref:Uncharacterized protein n=1 Tax=Mauremys mutica TaxID=74926 RepID=A0A9D3X0B5_9SAUR|nr:hypothetical protein KIL84_007012 [Mauremys mutica]